MLFGFLYRSHSNTSMSSFNSLAFRSYSPSKTLGLFKKFWKFDRRQTQYPEVRYSKKHVWVKRSLENNTIYQLGISDYAKEFLAPYPKVMFQCEQGSFYFSGDTLAVIRFWSPEQYLKGQTKLSRIRWRVRTPLSGVVSSLNCEFLHSHTGFEADPDHEQYLLKIHTNNSDEWDRMFSFEEYNEYLKTDKSLHGLKEIDEAWPLRLPGDLVIHSEGKAHQEQTRESLSDLQMK
ncbi:uncharacterized protein LOC126319986 [Schistocerca gregaria]|uniref:uncharacterized protein LOC126319986 n=1 Tax=Schistocerca gregaria TaxID=7010 RepID=UPI00211F43B6|nr:uncharacterized protein LOC126319986 [Schistocerca gregaria]